MFFIYELILLLIFILYIPVMLFKGKLHKDLWQRLGIFSIGLKEKLRDGNNIWVHAVSVGEVLAVSGLIKKISERFPEYKIVCTTVTKTGYGVAKENLKDKAMVLFAPLDFGFIVRKYIACIKPVIYISAETEIWPNVYWSLGQARVPIVLINGRISDKSFCGYKRIKFLIARALKLVNTFCMQTDLDAQRIQELGADAAKIKVTGNIKFDGVSNIPFIDKKSLGFKDDDLILVAGSTHPGEEKIIIEAFKTLKAKYRNLYLALAPRHIERIVEAAKVFMTENVSFNLYSKVVAANKGSDNILIDKMGQLRSLYHIADLVFIGKTFTTSGGQNMIEPVSIGKATFVGPKTDNFKSVMDIFLKEQVIVQVKSPEELAQKMDEMLGSKEAMERIKTKGREIVAKQQGASARCIEVISTYLPRV